METTVKTILEIAMNVLGMVFLSSLIMIVFLIIKRFLKGMINFKDMAKSCASVINFK